MPDPVGSIPERVLIGSVVSPRDVRRVELVEDGRKVDARRVLNDLGKSGIRFVEIHEAERRARRSIAAVLDV
jgi:hypothetical protein